MLHLGPIFFFWGGGGWGKLGILGGGSFYSTNTLDRALFLWVYPRDNPRGMLGEHKKGSVVDHDLMASDLCTKSFRQGLAVAFSHRQLLLDSLDFYSLGVFLF